jgi:ABC-type amino acid transport substrate-binding protein
MKKQYLIIITITFFLFSTLMIGASFEGIDRIKESGQLRILMAKDDWWPFFHVEETGELSGIDIIVSKKICENLGVEPVFIRKDSFNQLAPALKRGEGDVIISYFSYTPQRNTDVYLRAC